jgi:hypothetical protein
MQARRICILVAVALLLAACAHQPIPDATDPPGFFSGLWNGFTIFFSLIGSIFSDVRIYAFPNSGGWYDFGFFLGVVSWGGAFGANNR